ncbi:MAG: DUF1998 domain-containing protein [Gammaproteobacteria bacterium]|nr:DUF1998 domain-containing protein [Gammaproteobacteria bacterium]
MMDIISEYLPWFAFLASAVLAFIFDRLARLRRMDRGADRGDYWAFVIRTLCIILGPLLLLSAWMEALHQPYWSQGYHLYFDLHRVKKFVYPWSPETRYWLALTIPFAVWLLLLLTGIIKKPAERRKASWLAGAVGYANSRLWMLFFTVPPLLLFLYAADDLKGAYPAALWGTLAVFIVSLFGIAWSAGKPMLAPVAASETQSMQSASLKPWPEALKDGGIELEKKAGLPPANNKLAECLQTALWKASTAPARAVLGRPANNLAERLRSMGAQELAPELIEAVAALLSPRHEMDMHRVAFAPDHCGQEELVALAATILGQRYHAATLVITVGGANILAEKLRRRLRAENKVATFQRANDHMAIDALIWVVDAETLSNRLLPMMKNPRVVERIGFVVWWRLENFTGVLAANLWAISRRLDRLIQAQGRHEVRTLTLVRGTAHSEGQIARFLARLLPYKLSADVEVHVLQRFPKEVHLHVLESHHNFLAKAENRDIHKYNPHLILAGTKVSVEQGWPTHLEVPGDISDSESMGFLQLPVSASILRESLCQDVIDAGARLMRIGSSEILSIVEMISQGGRVSSAGQIHYVGILPPDNPYARYLLSTLLAKNKGDAAPGFDMARRLVGAEPHMEVIRRHLIMALNELPDTHSGLLKISFQEKDIIYRTLDKIFEEGKLTKEEVRYLDNGELKIESEYRSQYLPSGQRQPLDTVGLPGTLIDVRDPTKDEVQMCVDPERLTIQAYPHRIFMQGGRRYRIREWDNKKTILERGYVECQEENSYSETWRIRTVSIYGIKSMPEWPSANISRTKKPLIRVGVQLYYEEVIYGTLIQKREFPASRPTEFESIRLDEPISQEFATQALLLGFPGWEEPVVLNSLCQALRHVLPVHLGVEENALEVVPIEEEIGDIEIIGVAVVDLYPGGIGLIDALHDESAFVLQMLEWALKWLENCPCQHDNNGDDNADDGCKKCLRTVAARAAVGDDSMQLPKRSKAADLLKKVVCLRPDH